MTFRSLLLSAFMLAAAPAFAQSADIGGVSGIVAVVNDDVISGLDVNNRMQLVLSTTRLSDTPDVRARLRPQILRSLVDEKLQLQEAAKSGVTITDEDLQQAIAAIEAQRGIPPGELLNRLDMLGVPRAAILDQVKAQLAWTKVVLKNVRPKVRLSDDEIERERGRVKHGGVEVLIELLTLPVEHPENDAQVKVLAEKLVTEIRSGAPFESVARELGSSASTVQEIKPFWVAIDQLDPTLAKAITLSNPGEVADPVRTVEGYTLVRLQDRRNADPSANSITEIVFKDILLKLKGDASKDDVDLMLTIGKEAAKHPGDCSDPGIAGIPNTSDFDIQVAFRRETQGALPDQLKNILSDMQVGNVSEPFASRDGIRLFMLCERVERPAPLADREETFQRLYQQKLELEAQKYLRNLRREAAVDVRMEDGE